MRSQAIGISIAFSALVIWSVIGNSACAQSTSKPDTPSDYAKLLKEKLPPGWRCSHDLSTLIIAHDEDVTLLNLINLPVGFMSHEEMIRRMGLKTPYLIMLTFSTRLSDEEHRQWIMNRDAAVAAVKAKTGEPLRGTMDSEPNSRREFERHHIPEFHNERFSIHLAATTSERKRNGPVDGVLILAAPESAIDQRDSIMQLLLENMTPYAKNLDERKAQ